MHLGGSARLARRRRSLALSPLLHRTLFEVLLTRSPSGTMQHPEMLDGLDAADESTPG
jgi:hypothetical protein